MRSGSRAASRYSSTSMSFLSNCEIQNASAASEVSLSPSGTRKVTAPRGAVVAARECEAVSEGGGPGGDRGRRVSRCRGSSL